MLLIYKLLLILKLLELIACLLLLLLFGWIARIELLKFGLLLGLLNLLL